MKVLLLLAGLVCFTNATCQPHPDHCVFELGSNPLNFPLLLEKVDGRYKFLPVPSHGKVSLNNNQQVVATCQSQSFGFCTDRFGSVQLQCKHGKPYVAFHGKAVPYCAQKYVLSCKGPVVQHYPYPVEGCDKFGVVAAYVNHVRTPEPENNVVKLAGFCYDSDALRVLYADFRSFHSVFLDEQYVWNVETHLAVDAKILQDLVKSIDFYNFGPKLFNLKYSDQWLVGHLVPQPLVGSQYVTALSSSRLNQITLWQPLANRNWNNFLNVVKELTDTNVLDLFSGVSNGPRNVQPNLNAPTYVWLSVRAPKNNDFTNVVVVGVNVNGLNSQTVRPFLFGYDVFNQVPWLSSLNPGRLNPSDGYLFALSLEDAKRLIPEFPKVRLPSPNPTVNTRRRTTRCRTRTILVTRRRTTRSTTNTSRTRTVLVTRRRTTFGPFPCKNVKQSPNAPSVSNSQDIVLDINSLQLPTAVDKEPMIELPATDSTEEENDGLSLVVNDDHRQHHGHHESHGHLEQHVSHCSKS